MHCHRGTDAEEPQITAQDGLGVPYHWVCHVPCKNILHTNQVTDSVAESLLRAVDDIYLTGKEITCFHKI
jgi:hypothetical protein